MKRKQTIKIIFSIISIMVLNGVIFAVSSSQKRLTYPIVDTGVIAFYSNDSLINKPNVGQAFYGQDANYQMNQPSYTDNNDGTITDNVTGLMWQQDMGEKMTYDEAMEAAENCRLGGYDDWRVPTIKELYSLILFTGDGGGETAGSAQYINTDYFIQPFGDTDKGEREIDAQTWSSTIYTGKTMNKDITVFGVNFIDGRIKGYPMNKRKEANKMYFRFVRGNEEYGENNFIDNGDGTITDLASGLMWQKEDSSQGMDWENALSYAENLELAGYDDWRLPNAKELQSIVDYSRSPEAANSAAINPIFSISEIEDMDGNKQYPYFWTGTTHLTGKRSNAFKSAVYIAFGYAQGIMNNKLMDVHGAGSQRSDPKTGNPKDYPYAFGPQGDIQIVFNYARAVRNGYDSAIVTNDDELFNFAIQADIHLDEETEISTLQETFKNIVNSKPDFIMDLGDSLMLGDLKKFGLTANERVDLVLEQYSVFGAIPVVLINGNHDGENGYKDIMRAKSSKIRNEYLCNPFKDLESFSGELEKGNYFKFEKENSLFIGLDPFSYLDVSSGYWDDTLGKEQYEWLKNTLENSDKRFKFIFIHNLLGGINSERRGGVEASYLYEWGGKSINGDYEFDNMRPDFEMPIHDLLVEYNVTAVFHGHDHFYSREERDGIDYILVPQPGTNRKNVKTAKEKGYTNGVNLPSAGFLDISVSEDSVTYEYHGTNKDGGYEIADHKRKTID